MAEMRWSAVESAGQRKSALGSSRAFVHEKELCTAGMEIIIRLQRWWERKDAAAEFMHVYDVTRCLAGWLCCGWFFPRVAAAMQQHLVVFWVIYMSCNH